MKITVEIPIEPRQKYCVIKNDVGDCPYLNAIESNRYFCGVFFEVLETGRDGDSIRCKQCKEAEK